MVTLMRPFLIHRPEPPALLAELPDFSLVDHEGQTFGPAEMHGQVWVVGFIFTSCPTSCPTVSRAMLRFQDQIERSGLKDRVRMLSVTVDPETDRPEVLQKYGESLELISSTGDS